MNASSTLVGSNTAQYVLSRRYPSNRQDLPKTKPRLQRSTTHETTKREWIRKHQITPIKLQIPSLQTTESYHPTHHHLIL